MTKTYPPISVKMEPTPEGRWKISTFRNGRLVEWCDYATIGEVIADASRTLNGSLSTD